MVAGLVPVWLYGCAVVGIQCGVRCGVWSAVRVVEWCAVWCVERGCGAKCGRLV